MSDRIVFSRHVVHYSAAEESEKEQPLYIHRQASELTVGGHNLSPTKRGLVALSVALAFNTRILYSSMGLGCAVMFVNQLAMMSYANKVSKLDDNHDVFNELPEFKMSWDDRSINAVAAVNLQPSMRDLSFHLWVYENCAGKVYSSGDLIIFDEPSDMSLFLLSRTNNS